MIGLGQFQSDNFLDMVEDKLQCSGGKKFFEKVKLDNGECIGKGKCGMFEFFEVFDDYFGLLFIQYLRLWF